MGLKVTKVHDRRSSDTIAAGEYLPWEVADPYESNDTIVVIRNIRSDPLGRLHAHHQIDEAQYHAGRAFQWDWELAERGARAIDPTREAVDGRQLPEPLTDQQAEARSRLIRIRGVIGRPMYRLAHAVLIEGQTMEQYAKERTQWVLRYYGRFFQHVLDELAREYGLAAR